MRCFTIEEAARQLRVSRRTVYNYIAAGKLTVVRTLGRTPRIPEADLLKDARYTPPPETQPWGHG